MAPKPSIKFSGKIFAVLLLFWAGSLFILRLPLPFLMAVAGVLTLGGLMASILARHLTSPFIEMKNVVEGVSRADFSRRVLPDSTAEAGGLAQALNEMSSSLARQFKVIEAEKNQLVTILNGMVEGVLVTNGNGEVVLVNPALAAMLDLDGQSLGKTVIECLRHQAVHEAITIALKQKKVQEKEVTVWIAGEERNLIVHAAPLSQEGSVSVFYDVTGIRALENTRRDFVANVSHELKTPLTNILGYAETLRCGALNDAEASGRFVEKIENNAVQLKELVDDILKISEIESGRIELSRENLSLDETVNETLEDLAPKIKMRSLTVRQEISGSVCADRRALKQILSNLVENAVKYTPEGGTITLTAERLVSTVKVTVSDTGIGIPETDLSHIFERFYRVDRARSRQMGGTGLGLSIVKHLVAAHGGEVGVVSEVGVGSHFFFTLPLRS